MPELARGLMIEISVVSEELVDRVQAGADAVQLALELDVMVMQLGGLVWSVSAQQRVDVLHSRRAWVVTS